MLLGDCGKYLDGIRRFVLLSQDDPLQKLAGHILWMGGKVSVNLVQSHTMLPLAH